MKDEDFEIRARRALWYIEAQLAIFEGDYPDARLDQYIKLLEDVRHVVGHRLLRAKAARMKRLETPED